MGRASSSRLRRLRFTVQGQVQGVGFRPFVFRLAKELGLSGFVRNESRGVLIEVQGKNSCLRGFSRRLESEAPPLAGLRALHCEETPPRPEETGFHILASHSGQNHAVLVSPDTGTCPECLAEILDPENRRFSYPFTNCTACGPRYSIIRSVPYDRPSTSMACFPLCPSCRAEYENPGDRRFHAQPNACPECGPKLRLVHSPGKKAPDAEQSGQDAGDPLETLAGLLLAGKIAAIKGLGGFQLACDAQNLAAVAELRRRKRRPHKPFAVMVPDLEEAGRFAYIGPAEEKLLLSPEKPIVICPLLRDRTGDAPALPSLISPDTNGVGLMLPNTPLHFLLLRHFRELSRRDGKRAPLPAVLVMTSGNARGAPLCLGNREAASDLAGLADVFLFHNRDILVRVDDSVLKARTAATAWKTPVFFRRARGYAPRPLRFAPDGFSGPCVLGAGADLKNTLCLTKGPDAFVSQHIGDLEHFAAAAFHAEAREHLEALLRVKPELAVRDLHPDFQSGRAAEDLATQRGLPLLSLQHHFAHAHAVLGEHGFYGKALVMALDGHGHGSDGTSWGGEILYLDTGDFRPREHRRLAHLAPLDLPGGDAAAREPWRIAHALLVRLGLPTGKCGAFTPPWLPERAKEARMLTQMLARGLNCVTSTSCGRLFDAVSALLGLCRETTYEGQAATRLEEAQGEAQKQGEPRKSGGARMREEAAPYPCPFFPKPEDPRLIVVDSHTLFRAVYEDLAASVPVCAVAARFHRGLAAGLAACAASLAAANGVRHVGLSGGCFQNLSLSSEIRSLLEKAGLETLEHELLPPGDGCISFGQAVYGAMTLSSV
ncbi:MAG: carbamoyltransferase HypF [Desulfovibrio sp.]|jgi:hydrogenase maturation protein HypF|nr:carbamoyltransferase HypF [Desulfovibrio sp.]